MNTMFTALLAAATARVEVPVDGSTGVWIKEGTTVISSGMKMTGAAVSSGYLQNIYARGVAASCFVSAGGSQHVLSGGRALNTSAYGVGAAVRIYTGGLASGGRMEYGATIHVFAGGEAVGLTAQNGGNLLVSSGGTGLSASILASGGKGVARVYAGGTLNATHVSGGACFLYSGGMASGLLVESGGSLTVYSGGTALAVTSGGGAIIVSDGGYIEYA